MQQTRLNYALIVLMTLACGNAVVAQSSRVDWQIPSVIALDAGPLPDAFTSRCGRSLIGMAGWGAYVAIAARRGSFGLQGDTRAIVSSQTGGCTADLPVVVLGEDLYEARPGWRFSEGIPQVPLLVSTLRGAFEFGPSALRTTAKTGGGVVWGQRKTPVAVASLSTAFGQAARAFYLEFEVMQSWINATEEREIFSYGPVQRTTISHSIIEKRLKPRWFTLRAGMAFVR
ncbi:MAG: hypothetical protein ACREOG_20585 [Gemmatimonadaceae bacterium]